MTRDLLIRGMVAGIIAALLVTLFARIFAEPQVDLAIAYEAAHEAMHHMDEGPELISRATQKGAGLLTAVLLYGAAVGGIFALVFAATYGRIAAIGPRSLALLIAVAAFVVIAIVPALKYPPSPPAVGFHDTVRFRTIAYFSMIALSVVAAVIALQVRKATLRGLGSFNAMLAAGAAYIVIIVLAQIALPTIDEVPADFPAAVLWNFRVAAIAMQAILWLSIGIIFGALAERVLRKAARHPAG